MEENRYYLRYWEPSMLADDVLENLDFDPGQIYSGTMVQPQSLNYKEHKFVFILYGPDLWYASKTVAVCWLTENDYGPDFHIAVDPKHQAKGIGAVLLYAALERLPKADYLSTVATPDGERILTGMFGFSEMDTDKAWDKEHGWLGKMKPAVRNYLKAQVAKLMGP